MKKKFHKSGNPSVLRRNRLIKRMITQISVQASAFICLESIEKGKGFCGFPNYMDYSYGVDGNELRGYWVYSLKDNQIMDVVNVEGYEMNHSKDSIPLYQGRVMMAEDDVATRKIISEHLMCLSEAFSVCEEKVSEALDLYEDGIIAISIILNEKDICVYAWIRRDAESAKKIRENFRESDLPF